MNRKPLIILLGVCLFALAYLLERFVFAPWRKRQRIERMGRANSARIARDIEAARQNFAAIKNGRTQRIVPIQRKAGR